jgi:uncharacterized protein (DUF433 family)
MAGIESLPPTGFVMAATKQPLITSTPDILGGTPVFRGTRVPAQTLIEYLEGGQTIDEFLDGFPTVTREQVIAFLEEAKARMLPVAS